MVEDIWIYRYLYLDEIIETGHTVSEGDHSRGRTWREMFRWWWRIWIQNYLYFNENLGTGAKDELILDG